MNRAKLKLVFISIIAFCSIAGTKVKADRPQLVVLIAVDAFRFDYLTRFEKHLSQGGLKLLLERGANFTNTHIDHLRTSTGPGHATMLTGAYGRTSGIIENEWWDRGGRQRVNCVEDVDAPVFGSRKNEKKRGRSPRKLRVSTLGDELKLFTNFRSKVIGLSYKPRGAILPSGKLADAAYWYDDHSGDFVSSHYYMEKMPAWVREFNKRKIADSYFGRKWHKLLPEEAYSLSREDNFPHELNYKGSGIVFPHVINGSLKKPGVDFYKALKYTPFGDEHLAKFIKLVIDEENLGKDEYTDILTLSFSATDYISHQYGPYSVEVQDQVVRLDLILSDFLAFLDGEFGLDNVVIALTADHGMSPIPEYMARYGFNAGRIDHQQREEDVDSIVIPTVADSALDSNFGQADWVEWFDQPNLYLNHAAIRSQNLDQVLIENVAAAALRSLKGVDQVLTRTQILTGNLPLNEVTQRHINHFFPERSGDLVIHNKPYYLYGGYEETLDQGTNHETAYDYDTHIPLIIFGTGIKPGKYRMPVKLNDLAPTLSSLLDITLPSGNEGRVLFEALD